MKNEDRVIEILSESLRHQDKQYDLMIDMNQRFQNHVMESDKKFETLMEQIKANQEQIKANQEKSDKRFELLATAIQNINDKLESQK